MDEELLAQLAEAQKANRDRLRRIIMAPPEVLRAEMERMLQEQRVTQLGTLRSEPSTFS